MAKIIMSQRESHIFDKANRFVQGDVKDTDDAIKGAKDIIAEWISETETARNIVRSSFERDAIITANLVKVKQEEAVEFRY